MPDDTFALKSPTMSDRRAKDIARCKKYRDKYPDRVRDTGFRHRYGISGREYDRLWQAQGGVCAICGKPETNSDRRLLKGKPRLLSVDHDRSCCPGKRSCGKCIRGLLCCRCNTALGLFDDDVAKMCDAINYLQSRK